MVIRCTQRSIRYDYNIIQICKLIKCERVEIKVTLTVARSLFNWDQQYELELPSSMFTPRILRVQKEYRTYSVISRMCHQYSTSYREWGGDLGKFDIVLFLLASYQSSFHAFHLRKLQPDYLYLLILGLTPDKSVVLLKHKG